MELNVVQIYKHYVEKQKVQASIYRKVYLQCQAYIQMVVTNGGVKCVYDIPKYILGMPLYNIVECAEFLRRELDRSGFVVEFFQPSFLYISWDICDLERNNITSHTLAIKPPPPQKQVKFLLEGDSKSRKFRLNINSDLSLK